jgi:hypothetical protein
VHTDARQRASTHFRSITSRYNEVLRDAPVSDDVHPGFRGISDIVLTQSQLELPPTRIDAQGPTSKNTIAEASRSFANDREPLVTLHFFSQSAGLQFPTFGVRLGARPAAMLARWLRGHIAHSCEGIHGHAGELRDSSDSFDRAMGEPNCLFALQSPVGHAAGNRWGAIVAEAGWRPVLPPR